jgi:hypothetical protein
MTVAAHPALQARRLSPPVACRSRSPTSSPARQSFPGRREAAAPALAPPILATERACHHRLPHQIRASPTPAATSASRPQS